MSDWKRRLSQWTSQLNATLGAWKSELNKLLHIREPLKIVPYRSYGTPKRVWLMGRVLQNEGIRSRPKDASLWKNLLNMYRRFESDEVPNARVAVTFAEQRVEVVTNREGYFQAEIKLQEALDGDRLWYSACLELLQPQPPQQSPVINRGSVLVPTAATQFGVISDIDDTIVHTAATDFFRMVRIAYLGNARTRLPFKGVATFYQALQQGHQELAVNPIFYVSSSAWNMYDLFTEFLELQEIPAGPLLLKDTELSIENLLSFDHMAHKREKIEPILRCYPDLPFILIGDSGQKDAEIYTQIAQDFAGQILAIYIRDVSQQNAKRQRQLQAIAQAVRRIGTQFLVVADTEMAAMHAAEQGWIRAETLETIAQVSKQERQVA